MKKFFIFFEKWKWVLIFTILLIVVIIYKFNNPLDSEYFPRCIFKMTTGYDCPGCGTQRAIFHLLNFDFKDALKENLLFIALFPYILLGATLDFFKIKNKKIIKLKNIIYGNQIFIVIAILILFYWFFRNTTLYHHWIELF